MTKEIISDKLKSDGKIQISSKKKFATLIASLILFAIIICLFVFTACNNDNGSGGNPSDISIDTTITVDTTNPLLGEWYVYSLVYIDEENYVEDSGKVGEFLVYKVIFTEETINTSWDKNARYEVFEDTIIIYYNISGDASSPGYSYKGKFIFYGKDTLRMPNILPCIAQVVPPLFRTVVLVRIKGNKQ